MSEFESDVVCRCGHALHEDACKCGCEWDPAFCTRCGWLDCECIYPPGARISVTLVDDTSPGSSEAKP